MAIMAPGVGYLELYLGPMFSGKTSAVVQNFRRYTQAKKRVIVINHELDKRYSTSQLSTHDGICIPCCFADTLNKINPEVNNYDVILINEGQFFSDLFECVTNWVDVKQKIVIVCGLDGTSEREKFGQICDLIPFADKYEKLCSICENCGHPAPFTYRSPSESNGETIQIGVKEFHPLCRSCFIKAKKYDENNKNK